LEENMTDIAFRPALELARMIRDKEIGAEELLDHFLARIEKYNPAINAIILMQEDKARGRARAADAALARGENWGPLHGVAMTIKESFDWVGSPSTWGNPVYKDNFPAVDAVAVQRLEGAGAIVFGKSNVPLMLADWQSFNEIYGTASNPWDLSRSPGGSSGGSAAALAAGLTGLEIGSDIGASIRNPAHYCGVFGHKPTMGIVPLRGHLLPGNHSFADISVGGPLARSADDLAAALGILAGPEGVDAAGWRLDLPAPRGSAPRDFKVALMLDSPVCKQDDELTAQLQNTADALARLGVQVDDKARPDIDMARSHHVYLMLLRSATGNRIPVADFENHKKSAAARDPNDWSYRAYVDRAVTMYHRDWWALHDEREAMRLKWAEFFEEYDLLLCPTAASAAFPHDHEGERPERTIPVNGGRELTTDQLFWAGLSGVVFLPSSVAPAGLTASGLPCGMQMVAGHLHDRTAIEFARVMERELGGFVAPPGYE
jgi:amidase